MTPEVAIGQNAMYCTIGGLLHCKKRHLRSVPFLNNLRQWTENSVKGLNVKESSLKISDDIFP